jgi:hypothetical protein
VFYLVLATLSFFVLGTLGGALLSHSAVAGEIFIGKRGITLLYWLRWGGKVVGRFFGDAFAGILIGRNLHRINSHYVLLTFTLLPTTIFAVNRWVFRADDGQWIESVGIVGCSIQLISQVLMMFLVVSFGVWLGRRSLQRPITK